MGVKQRSKSLSSSHSDLADTFFQLKVLNGQEKVFLCCNPAYADMTGAFFGLQAMINRIFNNWLQNHPWDDAIQQFIRHVHRHGHALLMANPDNPDVMPDNIHLLPKRRVAIRLDAVSEDGRHGNGNIHNRLQIMDQRDAPDTIQCIVQKMRMNLTLKR